LRAGAAASTSAGGASSDAGSLASMSAAFFAAFFGVFCFASDGSASTLPYLPDLCCSLFLLATVSMSSRARRTRVARGAET